MPGCTKSQVHQAVADWAGISVNQVSEQSVLNGLGGKSWPQDADSLISAIEGICHCVIPPSAYETFAIVEDIDDYVDADDKS